MATTEAGEAILSDQSSRPRRQKSREVSSRYLSPTSSPIPSSLQSGIPSSPNHTLSPPLQKPRATTDARKLRTLKESGFIRGLWPSSSSSTPSPKNSDTLADHLANDRLKNLIEPPQLDEKLDNNTMFLNRQRSCTEFDRFEGKKKGCKENHKPIFGASMRYTGKFKFPGRSSTSSWSSSSSSSKSSLNFVEDHIVPGRFSVDENALRRKSSSGRKSDGSLERQDSGSDGSEIYSGNSLGSPVIGKNIPASYMAPTVSSRKGGIEVSSKYMQSRRWSSESNMGHAVCFDNHSPRKSTLKTMMMKRANYLTTYGNSNSNWALSPGRSSVDNSGKPMSYSSLRPPSSPSKTKGMGNLITMGLDLLKGKKSSSPSVSSPIGPGTGESVHQLRLLHNQLLQWRYANAKAKAVNLKIANQAESNFLYALDGRLTKLQHSVVHKRLQLEKEKLEMKLNSMLYSQIKPLEAWGDMERQHISALSKTKDCLHSVVCRIPLVEGAQVEQQSASTELRHAADLAASMKSMLSNFSPEAEKTTLFLSELAAVVAQEKSLLEGCMEQLDIISTLEVQERSLRCNIIQQKLWQQQQQLQQHGILV